MAWSGVTRDEPLYKKLIRKEGWTGLCKGLFINLFRMVPNSAVTMLM